MSFLNDAGCCLDCGCAARYSHTLGHWASPDLSQVRVSYWRAFLAFSMIQIAIQLDRKWECYGYCNVLSAMGLCMFLCTSLFMYALPVLYMQLHFMQLLLYCCWIFFTQVSVYIHIYAFHNSHTILYWAFYALHFLPIYPWVMFLYFFLLFFLCGYTGPAHDFNLCCGCSISLFIFVCLFFYASLLSL